MRKAGCILQEKYLTFFILLTVIHILFIMRSIGMTYEQGGGPAGGAAALTEEGDTLTLWDRVQHHHTTSLSTLEVASQNAQKLVSEFQNFYTNAVKNGVGDYKSFVIKRSATDKQRAECIIDLAY